MPHFRPAILSAILSAALLLAAEPSRAGEPSPMEERANPRVLIQRGERFLAMGKPEAAMACYAKVLACCEGSPEAAETHNDLGVALTRKGLPDQALAEYEKSLAGGYPLAHFNLGKAMLLRFQERGDPFARDRARAAFAEFTKYLRSGQTLPPAVAYNLGEIEEYLADALKVLGK
jgi:tetratricopeptide (TPR) repeat protein